MEQLNITPLCPEDCEAFEAAFLSQGWHKYRQQYEGYLKEQEEGKRQVFVARRGEEVLGYVTLLPRAGVGPFVRKSWPEISDFNVLKKAQRQGIGTALLDAAEAAAFESSAVVTLGVGMHSGYGSAQRMYVKRGYIPDGSGLWYRDELLSEGAPCANDDDLVLYFSKTRKK